MSRQQEPPCKHAQTLEPPSVAGGRGGGLRGLPCFAAKDGGEPLAICTSVPNVFDSALLSIECGVPSGNGLWGRYDPLSDMMRVVQFVCIGLKFASYSLERAPSCPARTTDAPWLDKRWMVSVLFLIS